ncbi:MAG: hypothetical protein ACRENP_07365 [Longimicrobiales bacterium]
MILVMSQLRAKKSRLFLVATVLLLAIGKHVSGQGDARQSGNVTIAGRVIEERSGSPVTGR